MDELPFCEMDLPCTLQSLVTQLTDAPVQFGTIPPDHWNQPPWIDENRASAARNEMTAKNIVYAGE